MLVHFTFFTGINFDLILSLVIKFTVVKNKYFVLLQRTNRLKPH